MKIADRVAGYIVLVLLSGLFVGGLAGILNAVLYTTIGIEETVPIQGTTKGSHDDFILSYTYFNKVTQKSYIVKRTVDYDQYEAIKGKTHLQIQYVGYFPGSPHIEGIDAKRPLIVTALVLVLVAFGIRRNILFLKGKLSAEEFT